MPINFPDAPSSGDTHTVGDKTWTWDGTAWNVVQNNIADHGNLGGLGDDDHTQYALADGTRGTFEASGAVSTHEAASDPHTQYLLADGTRTATELTVSGDLTVDTATLHVDSTNNRVGIGTTTPSASLEVVGTSVFDNVYSESTSNWNFSQLRATRNASNTANTKIASFLLDGDTASSTNLYDSVNFVLRTDSAPTTGSTSTGLNAGLEITAPDSVRFGTASTERMRIDSSGNVGIGTTTPAYTLDVNGTANATSFSGSGASLTSLNASNLASGTVPSARISGSYTGITGTGALNAGSISTGFGNIDIGTSTVTADRVQTALIGADGGDDLGIGAGETANYMAGNLSGESLWLGAEGDINLVTSPDNWSSGWAGRYETHLTPQSNGELRITSNSGYIEVGPKNTSYCHIYTDRNAFYFNKQTQHDGGIFMRGTLDMDNEIIDMTHAGAYISFGDVDAVNLQWGAGGDIRWNPTYNYIQVYQGSTQRMVWACDNGYSYAQRFYQPGGGSTYNWSDERLKRDVTDYSGGLAVLRQLRPVEYNWDCETIDDGTKREIGLIAQEVQEVYPNWVGDYSREPHIRASDGAIIEDVLALGFGNDFNVMVISALKELAERIEALESAP